MKTLAIVNPAAGFGKAAKLLGPALDRLRAGGVSFEVAETRHAGHATALAREGYAAGYRRFIAVGGDGTSFETVNGLFPEAWERRDAPTLGFLPLGTGNSFLRDFTKEGAAYAIRAILEGRTRPCDVIRLTHATGIIYYINILSLGFVADVATLANRRFKRLGAASYGLAVVLCVAAVPLWAAGHWGLGFAAAYLMAVLDSVDGKLARLTYTTSRLGDVMDHGTDLLHPPFWYAAWAWGLAGGPVGPTYQLTLWFFALYALDRVLAPIFKSITGKSIHGYAPIDVRMRTFISRRNVNLPVFTVALPLGLGAQAIAFVFAWQLACFLFHGVRVVQVWSAKRAPAH